MVSLIFQVRMGSVLAMLLLKQPTMPDFKHHLNIPLPTVMHEVISEDEIGDRRVLIIGDVHGCLDELQELLYEHTVTRENTVIIFCGDIINKGPKNIETLRYVRRLRAYVTRGNHEEHVLHEFAELQASDSEVPLREKYSWILNLKEDDIEYLRNLPYTISLPSLNSIVVHAGLVPWVRLEHQLPHHMTLMRNIVNGDGIGAYATKHLELGYPWGAFWNGPEHIYYGHDATRKLQIRKFATGLDTGCLYGGSLTAVFIHPDKKIVSVKAKKQYRKP